VGRGSGMADVAGRIEAPGTRLMMWKSSDDPPTIGRDLAGWLGWNHQKWGRRDASVSVCDHRIEKDCHGQDGNRRIHACQEI
jgi:hypothetical protein